MCFTEAYSLQLLSAGHGWPTQAWLFGAAERRSGGSVPGGCEAMAWILCAQAALDCVATLSALQHCQFSCRRLRCGRFHFSTGRILASWNLHHTLYSITPATTTSMPCVDDFFHLNSARHCRTHGPCVVPRKGFKRRDRCMALLDPTLVRM